MNRLTPTAIADLHMATMELSKTDVGFVIVKAQRVVACSHDHGVGSLIAAVERLRQADLPDAALADRIVGRAALLVALWGGFCALHAELISDGALEEATRSGLLRTYRDRVPTILNRRRDGPCPFELAAAEAVEQGLSLDGVISRLRALTVAATHRPSHVEDRSAI